MKVIKLNNWFIFDDQKGQVGLTLAAVGVAGILVIGGITFVAFDQLFKTSFGLWGPVLIVTGILLAIVLAVIQNR